MAIKRKVRPIVLKSAAKKAIKDRDKFRATTRIVLEELRALWVRLNVAVKIRPKIVPGSH